jgi:CMP-2-keto-3-deoxyoctulosonic acid synthetase
VLLAVLNDEQLRSQFDLILVSARLPLSPHVILNKQKQIEKQNNVELVLNSLYDITPEFKNNYALYFTSSVIPVRPDENENWIEFRFLPTEHLHIDVIKSLKKYTF